MLTRSFIHIPGVGPKKELAIWRAGVPDWPMFLYKGRDRLPMSLCQVGQPIISHCLELLTSPNGLVELAAMFSQAEHWRFYPTYSRAAFLDIETGGDPDDWMGLTVVGVYDGHDLYQYVAGRDLQEAATCLAGYDMVVTFSGASFDLPYLRRVFSGFRVPPLHIDLRWLLGRLGYRGGLKRIERMLNISRPDEVANLDGQQAVYLWRQHLAGSRLALDTLLAYNAQDVINLHPLLDLAAGRMAARVTGRLSPPKES